ncbi:ABC transporter permease subunit [Acetobacter farinalis]|uniref:ABC transporter permease subunit n=1 Tax=Acetobacter farinalis TaxID=1260984 RepID=A0ABT3Q5A8_9PROT|nr:ABC transporter permease subunit [Acetobacter farinalis]MCX2560429.1 ABC transporter permease subunit [Acetobacter farinalis]NHO29084.1 ABC transporter permease subunit [Acetobacter farinalis]
MTAARTDFSYSSQNSSTRLPFRHLTAADAVLSICVVGLAVLAGTSVGPLLGPLVPPDLPPLHLGLLWLPDYALRTSLRMLAALAVSLIFTFAYATLAAKSRRAARILVPLLDIFQSIPVLGFLAFTVTFFLGVFPGQVMGAELAAVFTVFTSQAWRMASGMYQSLRSVPAELEEAARGFGLTAWQKFWRLEVPCAIPALVWNAMMSMAGGWFVLVYAEAVTVGNRAIMVPGIGSYVALAARQRDSLAVLAGLIAMLAVILVYEQVLFRPLTVWASRFRLETGVQDEGMAEPWVLRALRRTRILRVSIDALLSATGKIGSLPLGRRQGRGQKTPAAASNTVLECLWWGVLGLVFLSALEQTLRYGLSAYTAGQIGHVVVAGFYTLLRVLGMLCLASLIWVPVGVWLGLDPVRARRAYKIVQFCAAFPANLFFPVVAAGVLYFHLSPDFWLTPLVMLGAQWYILFTVIEGASSFPPALLEVGQNFEVKGALWWRRIILPGIIPYYLTGVLAASGAAWNAALAAESVQWGTETLKAHGLGAYIAQSTAEGNMSDVALGVVVMALFVLILNWLVWRPLSDYAHRRLKLS